MFKNEKILMRGFRVKKIDDLGERFDVLVKKTKLTMRRILLREKQT